MFTENSRLKTEKTSSRAAAHRGPAAIQKVAQNSPSEKSESPAGKTPILVEEDVKAAGPGQLNKDEFLRRLYAAIYQTGVKVYQGTKLTVEGCPYISYWFEYYRSQQSTHIEMAVRKYVSAGAAGLSADDLIDKACERARRGFLEQVKTGKITELPDKHPQPAGDDAAPKPVTPFQLKSIDSGIMQFSMGPGIIQFGCLKGGGGAAAPPAAATVNVPMEGCVTVNDNITTLSTSGFAGCIGVILLGPGNSRTLTHINSDHVSHPNRWGQRNTLIAAAAAAHTAHIYHALTTWHQGDGGGGDQLLNDFGLAHVAAIHFHGAPAIVDVDPAGNVTP
jgi:hypothetical protein